MNGRQEFELQKKLFVSEREKEAKANREKYPWLVPVVDELREVFGPGVKVVKIIHDDNFEVISRTA